MNTADLRTAILCRCLLRRRWPRGRCRWKLAVYKADRLGDFVLALGAIRMLVEAAGPDRTVLVLTRHAESLAASEFPGVARVLIDPTRSGVGAAAAELWRRRSEPIFHAGVEHLVCLRHHRLPAESVMASAIPAATTWGTASSTLPGPQVRLGALRLDRQVDPPPAAGGECLELARHRAVLEAFRGAPLAPGALTPVLEPGWCGSASRAVASPFGSAPIRDIPRPLLLAAARHLRETHGLGLDLLRPPGESARFDELAAWLARAGCTDVRVEGCDSTDSLRNRLRTSRLVLSAETGTAHLAAALDAPLVALIGGGHFGWFAPWFRSTRQQWLSQPVDCRGCSWYCHRSTAECLTGIAEQAVAAAIDAALARV